VTLALMTYSFHYRGDVFILNNMPPAANAALILP